MLGEPEGKVIKYERSEHREGKRERATAAAAAPPNRFRIRVQPPPPAPAAVHAATLPI